MTALPDGDDVTAQDASVRTPALPLFWQAFLYLAFLTLAGALVPFLLKQGVATGAPVDELLVIEPANTLFWLAIDFGLLVFCLMHAQRVIGAFADAPLLVAYLALCFVSALWSADPLDAIRYSVTILAGTLACVAVVATHSQRQLFDFVWRALMIAVVSSLVFIVLFPQWGVMTGGHEGRWRGVFEHKNIFGIVCAILLLLAIERCVIRRPGLLNVLGALLALVCLYKAESVSGYLVTALGIGWIAMTHLLRHNQPLFVAGMLFGAAIVVAGLASYDEILGQLDRSADLTGRTDIWDSTWALFGERWLIGYGIRGFWDRFDFVRDQFAGGDPYAWLPNHAHNGYLDVLVRLGVVGGAIMAALLVQVTIRALRAFSGENWRETSWMLTFLVIFIANNMVEDRIASGRGIMWMIFILCVTHYAGLYGASRLRRRSALGAEPERDQQPMRGAAQRRSNDQQQER